MNLDWGFNIIKDGCDNPEGIQIIGVAIDIVL